MNVAPPSLHPYKGACRTETSLVFSQQNSLWKCPVSETPCLSLRSCCSCALGPDSEPLCFATLTWNISHPLTASSGPHINAHRVRNTRQSCYFQNSDCSSSSDLEKFLSPWIPSQVPSLFPLSTQRQALFLL